MIEKTKNFLAKLKGPTTEAMVSTLTKNLGFSSDLDVVMKSMKGKDIYYLWGVSPNLTSRAKDDDVIEKNYFAIDIDIRREYKEKYGKVLSQDELKAEIEKIKDMISQDHVFNQRSYIICSGNGMHILYLGKSSTYDKQEYKDGVKYIYKMFSDKFWDKTIYTIDTACATLWRLLRLPWSVNTKTEYKDAGIENTLCEIMYEQEVESELVNKIKEYNEYIEMLVSEADMEIPLPKKANTQYSKRINTTLIDEINRQSLSELVCEYTGRSLTEDGKNFKWGNNDENKWCFMSDKHDNVLIIEWSPHIPNPNNLDGHTTYTFIRDVFCSWNDAKTFERAKKRYPWIKQAKQNIEDVIDYHDHFLSYWDVLERAVKERRSLDIDTTCKYGIKILDEFLGWILPSELVVVWADSGIGKTELAYTISLENAMRGKKVMLFGLEGDINEIALRDMQKHISNESNTPINTISYRFNLDKSIYKLEDKILRDLNSEVKNNLLIFNKIEIPTLDFIRRIIEKAKDDVDLIVIDHLHYIHLDRDEELRQVGEIMRTLKTITDIIKKPIVLISHLRKKGNGVKERDPEMADLYGSSNIGKEATTVLLINRMRAVDTCAIGVELPAEELDKRYCGTKIIVTKSRIWLPKANFGLIYDTQKKSYIDKYQAIIKDESYITEEDSISKIFNEPL